MIVATWNVNSIRARLEHLLGWLQDCAPDIVGLQETKVQDADFPVEDIAALGYHIAFAGQKSYNGVALISRQEPKNVQRGLPGAEDFGARYISATFADGGGEFRFANVYVINGKEVGCQAYEDKLAFLGRLSDQVVDESGGGEFCLVGDFNIAPEDIDVYDPEEWRGKILCSEPERRRYVDLLAETNAADLLRELNGASDALYTWWDYRGARYRRKQGMRIDHILATPKLRARCRRSWVDEGPRKLERPSDHTPVLAEFG